MESSIIIATPKLSQMSFLSCDLYKGNTSFPLSLPHFPLLQRKKPL